ncbi:hypothetical protein O6H91_23G015900 [Diphasiastrum complanatum]|uniref:Uncharacterized protein n=1 Tax=Diphasiastrum complanatum TaxID=34168 RepID=A0ACC2A8D5_DIPCM|nr:hypothetical protein O6H91_23G015900 [Diphasiastrum complanatum]
MNLRLQSLLNEAASVPFWEWAAVFGLLITLFLYHVLDFHFFGDLLCGLRGDVVRLYYSPSSKLAADLVSKCNVLKSRYSPTPWLRSPHLQIAFLHYLGRAPIVNYSRQLFSTPDGGTIALDWVKSIGRYHMTKEQFPASDETPIVVVIPGLTSDSTDAYVKHLVAMLYSHGWKAVVANHRGLGGVSITSDCFYNAGWTEDLRRIVAHLHIETPKARLFAIGTSIGANILVKYLGEEGKNTPLSGATAICCPWDLVVCDRFIHRGGVQKIYNTILTTGLRDYARQHQSVFSRMTDWQMIDKSRTIRDFDNFCTRLVGNYETVDTYYRRCSSIHFLEGVSVPLLCISSLDDPVCTKEAIPWDECSTHPYVILAVARHGSHIAFFEGLTASSMWWVRSVTEFLTVLLSSSSNDVQEKMKESDMNLHLSSEIDKGPYLKMSETGKVSAGSTYSESILEVPPMPAPVSDQLDCSPSPSAHYEPSEIARDLDTPKNIDVHPTELNLSSNIQSENEIGEFREHDTSTPVRENEPATSVIQLQLQSQAELLALRSVLFQLLEQVQTFDFSAKRSNIVQSNESETSLPKNALLPCESSPASLSTPTMEPQALEHQSMACSSNGFSKTILCLSKKDNHLKSENPSLLRPKGGSQKHGRAKNESQVLEYISPILGSIKGLIAQSKWTLWLVAYVAIVTTYPLFGSALLIRLRAKFVRKLNKKRSR